MTDVIAGKVARVNSDRELIINRGSDHGVDEGMLFRIKGAPVDITDPETGDSIGRVSRVKVVVRVEEVDLKFCIARTFRTRRINIGGAYEGLSALSQMFQPPKWETRIETLRRDPSQGQGLPRGESVVAVGDIAETAEEADLDAATSTTWR